ncbi:MAG: hypothetical protein FJX68_12700 [Alphaproteobacteria bacterium]|nr:hypothetical protein [Alphaproteobacteria bacterium]
MDILADHNLRRQDQLPAAGAARTVLRRVILREGQIPVEQMALLALVRVGRHLSFPPAKSGTRPRSPAPTASPARAPAAPPPGPPPPARPNRLPPPAAPRRPRRTARRTVWRFRPLLPWFPPGTDSSIRNR